ncbi:MAG: hypothetical protein KBS57_06820, partial [Alistipes sp.]|nr:hypothetical protein [Candidatus Minthomonas equi]
MNTLLYLIIGFIIGIILTAAAAHFAHKILLKEKISSTYLPEITRLETSLADSRERQKELAGELER